MNRLRQVEVMTSVFVAHTFGNEASKVVAVSNLPTLTLSKTTYPSVGPSQFKLKVHIQTSQQEMTSHY